MSSFVEILVRVYKLGEDIIESFPGVAAFSIVGAILGSFDKPLGGFAIVWDGGHKCDDVIRKLSTAMIKQAKMGALHNITTKLNLRYTALQSRLSITQDWLRTQSTSPRRSVSLLGCSTPCHTTFYSHTHRLDISMQVCMYAGRIQVCRQYMFLRRNRHL